MKAKTYHFPCSKICRAFRASSDDAFEEFDGAGPELWTLTVALKDLPLEFPYGPNAREAKESAAPVKEMLSTLESAPESFILKNNGIMLVAESLKPTRDEVTLVLQEAESDEDELGHGVLNGGHTYLAVRKALADPDHYPDAGERAHVVVTVALNINEDEIWRISKARNMAEKVPPFALRNLAGDWSDLRAHLPEKIRKTVAFKPNEELESDSDFNVTWLVRRLALINNKMFPMEDGVHPVAAYSSIGSLVKKYKPEDFKEYAPLLPDVLELEELIVRTYERLNGTGKKSKGKLGVLAKVSGCSAESMKLLTGYRTKHLTLADPFIFPVIAAFRAYIKDGEWVEPIDKLWEEHGEKCIRDLWEFYRKEGRSSSSQLGRSKAAWAQACDSTKFDAAKRGLFGGPQR